MQIKYINRALQRFDSTQVIPTQFVLFTISVILGSAVLYRDFERQTTDDAIKFVAGCALTFFGVWLITSGRKSEKDSDEEEALSDDEGAIDLIDETEQQPEIRERPQGSARLQSVRSRTPSVVVTNNDFASQSASFGAPSPLEDHNYWTGTIPTNISSIHAATAEHLPVPPSRDGKAQPPRMHATTSAPIIPTSSNLSPRRPVTPIRQRSTPYGDSPHHFPTSPYQATDPVNTPGRRSIIDMLPGPLVAPLSSSLSAIIADNIRKGMEVRPRTMERRRPSRKTIRPQRSYGGESRPSTSPHSGYPLRLTTTHEASSSREGSFGHEGSTGRGRSLSTTVSDIFRTRRSRAGTLESAADLSEAESSR